ncbi:MAG: glycosyltransferase family 1 protein [bacterium]
MRIVIDARAYSWAGVGRYIRNLLKQLGQLQSGHRFVVLLGKQDIPKFKKDVGERRKDFFDIQEVEASYYSWQEQTTFLWQLRAIKADLYHFTHFNVPLFFNQPYLVTIHDVTRFIFPGQRQQGLVHQIAYEQVFKHAVEKARGVICVSETTKRDLKNLPLKLPNVVETIYEGVEKSFTPDIRRKHRQRVRLVLGTQDPYLLYVGVWMNHKNLPRLLAAYKLLLKKRPNLKLVLTGRARMGDVDVLNIAKKLKLDSDKIIYPGFVPQKLLPALYAEAACLVLPSLYEGFGLPALEAMACGIPVVASNVSSLPEILGQGAEYVNPEYTPGIAAGIERALGRINQCNQTRRFSWERCAFETLSVYTWVG